VRLRTNHPLASPLRALFRAEARRVEDLLTSLREVARTLEPAPTSVWIEGPVLAHGEDAVSLRDAILLAGIPT
jgi:hypothetical protein